ncbi:MAG: nitrogen fixation protein NifH [Eubacteriaceae bacterium]|nr:nitrogen fixation protein NifH [Eubacteriaceae bacterium]
MEIAIYGKGGIGKSTVAANLSAAMSMNGSSVLQIGCDPKHDSTRLLLGGRRLDTALDYMRNTNPPDYNLNAILATGFAGVGCIEAGGPQPGVGCAGRGIISLFELLSTFQLKGRYDATMYDVLGDVVCGGFAVPIRREYADTIFIVTSGEFMALYAANNILRGIRNYDGSQARVGGVILNRRGIDDEADRVQAFCSAVGLPVIADIPRSSAFMEAEAKNMTLAESSPKCPEAIIFDLLAKAVINGVQKHEARPLSDEDLEHIVLGATFSEKAEASGIAGDIATSANLPACIEAQAKNSFLDFSSSKRYLSKSVANGEALSSCAFNGALYVATQIRDAVVIAHAPKSCVYISYNGMGGTGRRRLFERGSLLPSSVSPNLVATDMGEPEMVFGGMEKLEQKVAEVMAGKPKAIIIASACPSGIIGDDIDQARALGNAGTPIFTLKADGNMTGDYSQGTMMSYIELARQVIDTRVQPEENLVNILFERPSYRNTPELFEAVEGYLLAMGVKVNCRFLCETDYESLAGFNKAALNLLANDDYSTRQLKGFFETEFGAKFFGRKLPIGFGDTVDWLREIGGIYGKQDVAESIVALNKERYEKATSRLRASLEGKRLMVVTYSHDLDWLLGAAVDSGIEIAKLCIIKSSSDEGFRTKISDGFFIEEDYDISKREADIALLKPDILLSNYTSNAPSEVAVVDALQMVHDTGFFAGLDYIERWAGLLALGLRGEWENDERLFNQYYS